MSVVARDAERRQLTVLFCDLVDSTRLSQQLDAEAYRELILAYQGAVSEVIDRYEGHVAQYLGDGMLVYFGHPEARDDDAERAVRAGYAILTTLKRLNDTRRNGAPLATRIGVHTGTAIVGAVGTGGRQETLALGETSNFAARLQGVAAPDAIVISGATLKLVPGLFVTRDLGQQQVKGIERPVAVHQVLQPSGVRTRLEAAHALTPFVGRVQELALLMDRWERACEGQGQAVLLTAEPGMGKSRLTFALRDRVKDTPHTWLECRCAPMTRNTALAPVIELLTRGLQLRDDDGNDFRLQRLEQGLDTYGADRQEAVPLMAPLLNITFGKAYAPSPYGPELKRKKLLELLAGWSLALSRHQPLVLVMEDLHWADPSTLDMLQVLLEQLATHPVLLVVTARPEFQPSWPTRPHTTHLSLPALRLRETEQMVGSLLEQARLAPAVVQRILQRAGGVPLFVEEITKAVLESAAESDATIPATLQDSLAARIDRLGAAKPLLQLCSVVGREIPYALLSEVAELDEASLLEQLKVITDSQLLYQRGAPPQATFLFKHALIQDTAYESLLRSSRQKLHGRIAGALEQKFPERARSEPGILAEHLDKAGSVEQALEYLRRAGEAAWEASAAQEVIRYNERRLQLLAQLPAGDARDLVELNCVLNLSGARTNLSGFGHPEVGRLTERIEALLKDSHEPLLRIRALASLWVYTQFSGQFERARVLAQRIVVLGREARMPVVEAFGHAWAGLTFTATGRYAEGLSAVERALPLCVPATEKAVAAQLGSAPSTGGNLAAAFALWTMGFPDQAQARVERALQRAIELGPNHACVTQSYATATFAMWRRDPGALLAAADAAFQLCEKYGHANGLALSLRARGMAWCQLGRIDEGVEAIRQSVAAFRAAGSVATLPMSNYFLAERLLAARRWGEAHAALQEALELAEQLGHGWFMADMHRLRGELLLGEEAEPSAVEACFSRALEISRGQQARSFELRSAMSLARLWQGQGRSVEARGLLKPVYEWFTEGFDTPDLKDAKVLLDSLG